MRVGMGQGGEESEIREKNEEEEGMRKRGKKNKEEERMSEKKEGCWFGGSNVADATSGLEQKGNDETQRPKGKQRDFCGKSRTHKVSEDDFPRNATR